MRQKYHNPHIRTGFPIEEHAASVLTPYAFDLLQHEIELSTKYAATEIDNGSYIVQHHTKVEGGRLVSWIVEQESIDCSCKEFQFSGILCKHAIRVLMVKNYFILPSKYLPFRWRRESSFIPKSSHVVNYNSGSSAKFQSLIRCLEVESSKTKEREQIAIRGLEKVVQEIKDMPEREELLIDLEPNIDTNNDGYEIENPIVTKSKGRPKGSRPKGGVEAAKKPLRYCQVPGCDETDHDMTLEIVQTKRKILKYCLLNLLISKF
ncbi:FAR1-RELATED SEQUENCE [Trifolium repens]|nr:FAR1-RELATED SEQUENCE [Trifolium repens]